MKVQRKLKKPAVLLVVFLFFLPQNLAALGENNNTQNSHLAARGAASFRPTTRSPPVLRAARILEKAGNITGGR